MLAKLLHLYPVLCNPLDCSPQGPSIHGVFQARILEWGAILFSRGSSWIKDQTWVSCVAGGFFTMWATREGPLRASFGVNSVPVLRHAVNLFGIVLLHYWTFSIANFDPWWKAQETTNLTFLKNCIKKSAVYSSYSGAFVEWNSLAVHLQLKERSNFGHLAGRWLFCLVFSHWGIGRTIQFLLFWS